MDPSLTQLVKGAASAEREALGALDFEGQRHRFLKYARRRNLQHRARGWLALGALAASLLVAWFALHPAEALNFQANGEPGNVGALLAAPESSSLLVDFSDGSQLNLKRRTRARVLDLGHDSAHLKLENGSLLASVVHADRTRWQVDAGPFQVLVVGTRFRLRWDRAAESFRLELYDGSVKVSGPKLRQGCVVSAGSELHVTLGGGASQGSCLAQQQAREHESTAAEPPKKPTEPVLAPAAPEATPGRSKAALASWRELAAEGSYARAWAAIQAQGFEEISERANAAELMSLADAARFAGKPSRAAQALLALRTRFSGSREARDAAFLLGRVAADQEGRPERGAQWFSTYLTESPAGSFAPEALGRLLDCQIRAGNRQQAKQTAQQYLTRYPRGSYRGLAEHQLREHGARGEGPAGNAPRLDTTESGKTR